MKKAPLLTKEGAQPLRLTDGSLDDGNHEPNAHLATHPSPLIFLGPSNESDHPRDYAAEALEERQQHKAPGCKPGESFPKIQKPVKRATAHNSYSQN